MVTAIQVQDRSVVERLIRPAIVKMLSETDGSYRCERDLHHHFTVTLHSLQPLGLGTRRRIVNTEEPCYACYGKGGRRGNLDYFFPATPGKPCSGVAVELNCDYRDGYTKIVRDIQKLIDPKNNYPEAVYFAYGRKRRFFDAVKSGIKRAFEYFADKDNTFQLPPGLQVIVVERQAGSGGHVIREAVVTTPCAPEDLTWTEEHIERLTTAVRGGDATSKASALHIEREEAEALLYASLSEAGIPLNSITARCVFEATRNSSGQNRCKFGVTPLWGNELKVVDGRASRSDFIELVRRLCDSGHAFQKAGRASWGVEV